jgi:hypothetical protein
MHLPQSFFSFSTPAWPGSSSSMTKSGMRASMVSPVTWITDKTSITDRLLETPQRATALSGPNREFPMTKAFAFLIALFSLAACGSDPGTRALTGGAIGAGSGAVIGSVTPIGPIGGAVVGGVGGAVIGAATTPLAW